MQVGSNTTLLVAGLGLLVGIGMALFRRWQLNRASTHAPGQGEAPPGRGRSDSE